MYVRNNLRECYNLFSFENQTARRNKKTNMNTPIPIIDIFAGPGGLGEGFSSVKSEIGNQIFRIKLSIEKDQFAHQTLELRAFYRQFIGREIPIEYYKYLRGEISRDNLFDKYPVEAMNAREEAWLAELGKTEDELVDFTNSECT